MHPSVLEHCLAEDSRSHVRAKFCSLVTARAPLKLKFLIILLIMNNAHAHTCNTTRDYMDSNSDQLGGKFSP